METLQRHCQEFTHGNLVCDGRDQTFHQISLLPAWALTRIFIYSMSGFTVMQPNRSIAYKEFVLIISLFVQHTDEWPGTCQEKSTSSPVVLQREMGMAGNPVWLLPAPGISIQWYQQALNTQRWALAHLLHVFSGRQSSWFSEEVDVYRVLLCTCTRPHQREVTKQRLSFLRWYFVTRRIYAFLLRAHKSSTAIFTWI